MAIETNLNTSPYFDDFESSENVVGAADKNYHRILFRPGYSVQARELTQIQTILQNQVERFANEVLVDGTVVTGVGLTTSEIEYVKLLDKDANNRVLLLSDFYNGSAVANVTITGNTSGVTARLIDVKEGSQTAAPNYLSLFVAYTNSGTDNTAKTFADNETLLVRWTANSTFKVAARTIPTGATGKGFRASVSDGIVYHKGHFVKVSPQSIIVDKYSLTPNKKVGFETRETIIDSNADSFLLDQATGATNYSAPGANRLKLTPVLATRSLSAANTTTFFTLANIENGSVIQRFTDTTYSDIGQYVNEKFYETHGNYAIEPFNLRIREHLKRSDNLGRYNSSGGGDKDKLVVEVEKGIGYVSGNRISIEDTIFRDVDKATDYAVTDNRTVGMSLGHYVVCKEVVGQFDFRNLKVVKLYSSPQKGISGKNLGAQGANGNAIGEARVRGIEWDSGTMGTALGQFRIYLFDVRMYSGYSFSQVRSLYDGTRGGSLNAMADIILETDGTAKIKEPGLNSLVFPFSQKGTKTLRDSAGTIDTKFVVRKSAAVTIGAGGAITSFGTANAATGTSDEDHNDSGTLDASDRRNFIIISREAAESTAKTGTISAFSGNTITGSGTDFSGDYSVGDFITFTHGSNTAIERITAIGGATSISVANTFAWTGSGLSISHKAKYPSGTIFDLTANGSITGTEDSLTIDIGRTFASDTTATVYWDVIRYSAVHADKVVNKDKFVHINTGNNAASSTGPWSLGVSDAFKLVKVYKGSNTGVTTADTDVTSEFELDNGMKDGFYGTAKLRKKATSALNTTNAGLMVKFNYFGRSSSNGYAYTSVDSYPIDPNEDSTSSSAITTQEIPVFISPTTGRKIDLRDAVDFRPFMANTCAPSATGTVSSAPTNPRTSNTFSYTDNAGVYNISPSENFNCDLQYYLPRKDRVVLTKEGEVEVIKGVAAVTPKTPDERAGSMTLGVLNIPVYPSLSPYVGKAYNRQDYSITLNLENNRRYTMKDLRAVEQRVKTLEYYSSLNALEASAKNKQIFGDTGIDRYKNGFLVDNFDGHNISDTTKVGYRAAIDRNRTQLRPTYTRNNVSLSKDVGSTSSNIKNSNGIITLSYTNADLLNQSYASKLRNPVQEMSFDWKGEVILNPPADNTPDITTLPDIQVDFDGMYQAIQEIADLTGVTGTDWGNWITTNQTVTTENVGNVGGGNWAGFIQATTTQSDQIISGLQTTISPSNETFSIGNFVENVAVREYMRSRLIQFTGVRMKPNTRVYPYFDDELVTEYCTPCNSSFANTLPESSNLVTDSTGTVYGVFRVPNDDNLKFRVGTKRFALKDVANTQTQSSLISTSAHGDYTSIPLDVTQRGTSVNMVVPQVSRDVVTDNRTLTTVSTATIVTRRWDPLAQTFTVAAGASEGVFVTKLDLWFGKKSSTYPITVQLREVENGFPTTTIVPYGSVTLQPGDVNVFANSAPTASATSFEFPSPVFLKNNTDYAFVVMPAGNSDDYTLWCSELGGTDVNTNELIHKQPAGGVLFVSSNDKTWNPIQSEDVKFKLHKANFTTSGTVYLDNENDDYFSVDNLNGSFNFGEKIVAESVLRISGVAGNSAGQYITVGTVIANNRATSTAANGVVREIVQEYANGVCIVKIDPYNSAKFSGMAADSGLAIYGTNFTNGRGKLSSYSANTRNGFVKFYDSTGAKLHISDSTGTTSTPFANGFIRGQVSGGAARVTSVNNIDMNTLVPKIPQITYGNTAATWTAKTTSSGGVVGTTFENIDLQAENNFTDGVKRIYSKSNKAGRTLILKGALSTTDTNVSPVIDNTRSNGVVIENIINSSSTDEHKDVGNALMRYMTRPVTLADGQEAEDLLVYLTAYKPQADGLDIKVYARIHNPEDSEGFVDKDWTPLRQITAANTYSDSVNRNDFREFEFGFSANTDGLNFLGTGWANNHAYLNTANSEVVAYRSGDGSYHSTYKTYAIKIVMTSGGSNIIPLCRDMRAIALQK